MRPRRIQNKAIVHPLLQNTHDYNEDTYNAIEDMRMSNVENKKINGLFLVQEPIFTWLEFKWRIQN